MSGVLPGLQIMTAGLQLVRFCKASVPLELQPMSAQADQPRPEHSVLSYPVTTLGLSSALRPPVAGG
jgi:hypothetical protein